MLEQEGYELLNDYINSKDKVELKCPKDHIYSVAPNRFQQGDRCPKCSGLCPTQAKEQFIELLEREEYELLNEYVNSKTKVKLMCLNGHMFEMRPNSFKNGQRCPKCNNRCTVQAKEHFEHLVEQNGYVQVDKYINERTKVLLICPEGHECKVWPYDFKKGRRCSKCSNNCPEQAKENFISLLEQEGYKLIGEYVNTITKVKLKCPDGHIWDTRPSNFIHRGTRCPHCRGSSGQIRLQEMLLNYVNERVVYNDRSVLIGLELDIYYPDLMVAIEYQGDYWHGNPDKYEPDDILYNGVYVQSVWNKDDIKRKYCRDRGIKLIEIWESDFMNDPKETCIRIKNVIRGGDDDNE